jgi:hypothetical protein
MRQAVTRQIDSLVSKRGSVALPLLATSISEEDGENAEFAHLKVDMIRSIGLVDKPRSTGHGGYDQVASRPCRQPT